MWQSSISLFWVYKCWWQHSCDYIKKKKLYTYCISASLVGLSDISTKEQANMQRQDGSFWYQGTTQCVPARFSNDAV